MTELEFAKRAEAAGGRAYIVGGWVRDRVREVPAARSHDRDYVLEGFSYRRCSRKTELSRRP